MTRGKRYLRGIMGQGSWERLLGEHLRLGDRRFKTRPTAASPRREDRPGLLDVDVASHPMLLLLGQSTVTTLKEKTRYPKITPDQSLSSSYPTLILANLILTRLYRKYDQGGYF